MASEHVRCRETASVPHMVPHARWQAGESELTDDPAPRAECGYFWATTLPGAGVERQRGLCGHRSCEVEVRISRNRKFTK